MKKSLITQLSCLSVVLAAAVSCNDYAPDMGPKGTSRATTSGPYPPESTGTATASPPATATAASPVKPQTAAPTSTAPVAVAATTPAPAPVAAPPAAPVAVATPPPAAAPSGATITIKPNMPKPLFAGTPVTDPNPPPNLEKPGNPITEATAPEGTVLLSKGKPVTSSDTAPLPSGDAESLKLITDGELQGDDGYFADLLPGKQWIQVDLGDSKTVHLIWLWHFHKQAVMYKDVIVTIGEKEDGSDGVIVFNNDYDNTAGMGAGKDVSYIETNNGRSIPVSGVKGRYVRFWSNGRNIDDTNQYIEVEIHGK